LQVGLHLFEVFLQVLKGVIADELWLEVESIVLGFLNLTTLVPRVAFGSLCCLTLRMNLLKVVI